MESANALREGPLPQRPTRGPKERNTAWGHLALGALLLALFSGCSSNYRFEKPEPGYVQRGMASWYGEPFHGRRTANGEVYDMHGISAAHKELPLGTVIDVTNLENGRKLRMRINDRGPYIKGRILDLSYGAAQNLDVVRAGLARVEIRVVEVGGGRPGPALTSRYTIQLGAFSDRDNALKLHRKMSREFADVEIHSDEGLHRVRVGNFKERADAEKLRRKLQRRGMSAMVVPLK